ncbi:MAG: Uma2 family endonuclease [Verrucomicrobiales bacterium]|jgi:Uma2 family endonuclease
METFVIQLPLRKDQHAFNLERWDELSEDSDVQKLPNKIETDRHGNVIMMPPASMTHGSRQTRISFLLQTLIGLGRAIVECPISTSDSVTAADVVWISKERLDQNPESICTAIAPEICIEVFSPRNRMSEMQEKKGLYFAAGADEVWFCDLEGAMSFYLKTDPDKPAEKSALCQDFPQTIELS